MTAYEDQDPDENGAGSIDGETPARGGNAARWVLNGLIIILLPLIGFSAYLYFSPKLTGPSPAATDPALHSGETVLQQGGAPGQQQRQPAVQTRVIQLDVLNGCGVKGAGNKMTSLLRAAGFDVVEMKNYKTFHVPKTLVVDRVGNLAMARQVAAALGVGEKNVIQQINPDYYVDVSVIIGKDYQQLLANRE